MKDMTTLTRGQIGRTQGLNTTVKSATGPWRAFAPTWDMVMAWKTGALSQEVYTAQYQAILQEIPPPIWDELAALDQATLLCYCRDGWFCHTHLIIQYAIQHWPDRFQDGRSGTTD